MPEKNIEDILKDTANAVGELNEYYKGTTIKVESFPTEIRKAKATLDQKGTELEQKTAELNTANKTIEDTNNKLIKILGV